MKHYLPFIMVFLLYSCGGSNDSVNSSNSAKDLSLGQQLALIDKNKQLPANDDYVIQLTKQLELLSNKYNEPQDTIAEWTNKAKGVLHEQGVEDYNLSILQEISKIPKMDNTRYKDVATLYVTLKAHKQ